MANSSVNMDKSPLTTRWVRLMATTLLTRHASIMYGMNSARPAL